MGYDFVMMKRLSATIFVMCASASCAPSVDTKNEDANSIVSQLVLREAPFHHCVEVTTTSGWVADFPDVVMAPNTLFDVTMFEDASAVLAAREIAVSFDQAMQMEAENQIIFTAGETGGHDGSCSMSVTYPSFSGDFAFLDFHSPGGDIGVYVFERHDNQWRVNERIHLGWW